MPGFAQRLCAMPRCDQISVLNGFCRPHAVAFARPGDDSSCAMGACTGSALAHGLCATCQRRAARHHVPIERYAADARAGCAICRRTDRRLDADHDHRCCGPRAASCGRCYRGLLCRNCNLAVGRIEAAGAEVVLAYIARALRAETHAAAAI